MNVPTGILLDFYSGILIVFLLFAVAKSSDEHSERKKALGRLLLCLLIMVIADALGRLDGIQALFPLAAAGNFIQLLADPIFILLWMCYDRLWTAVSEKQFRYWLRPFFVIAVLNTIAVTLSLHYGWFYFFDSRCIYHRGPFFPFRAAFMLIVLLSSNFFILLNRKKIEKKYFRPLLLFPIPPLLGGFAQVLFYGLPLGICGSTFSVLALFIFVQSRNLDTDYLTGAYNRRKLDAALQDKINSGVESHSFSVIMLDLDHFKQINDTLGHISGDNALEDAVRLLRQCFCRNDFIARYGGDEFCIILETGEEKVLNAAIDRITNCFLEYNKQNKQAYDLSCSIGYLTYDSNSHLMPEQFLAELDQLMYQNKAKKRLDFSVLQ